MHRPIPDNIAPFVRVIDNPPYLRFTDDPDMDYSSAVDADVCMEREEAEKLFYKWKEMACIHGRDFVAARFEMPNHHFNQFAKVVFSLWQLSSLYTVCETIIQGEEYVIPTIDSDDILDDLKYFGKHLNNSNLKVVELINTDHDKVLYRTFQQEENIFMLSHEMDFSINETGMMIKAPSKKGSKNHKILFQSKDILMEHLLDGDPILGNEKCRYTDLATGIEFIASYCLDDATDSANKSNNFIIPLHYKVESRKLNYKDYDHVIKGLKKVFIASRETGNNVYVG